MKNTMKKIFEASKYDPKSLTQKALKLSEECGEVAEAVLSFTEAPGCSYKNKALADVVEETWDVIITAGSILYQLNVDEKTSVAVRDRKLDKWIKKSRNKESA